MPRRKKGTLKLAALDCETDPFKEGRVPQPFCVGLYMEDNYICFWGDDCFSHLADWLRDYPEPLMIYAHNGGKFDFHVGLFPYLDNPVSIINGRIVKANLFHHVVKDSYALVPVALAKFGGKQKIDYNLFERETRERHKNKILDYLYIDCYELFRVMTEFHSRFGNQLTMAKTAIKQLEKITPFIRMHPTSDAYFRQYYYGGRVQCFKTGIQIADCGEWKVYDVNSMYPYVMKTVAHPVNGDFTITRSLPDDFERPYFAKIIARNRGCLPWRDPSRPSDPLTFDREHGEFFACSHEIRVGLKYGLIDIERVDECYIAREQTTFADFITTFYDMRMKARAEGDQVGDLLYKLIPNSSYGKFGQDPSKYKDYKIWREAEPPPGNKNGEWELFSTNPYFQLWAMPARINRYSYFDVSIAASITSAARAQLLEGIHNAVNPIYCDTDSLICEALNMPISSKDLGAWKHELSCDRAAIAGKKLYALYNKDGRSIHSDPEKPKAKIVSKGGTLTLKDIQTICAGETVEFASPVPTFSLRAAPSFITRKFRKTA